MKKVYCDLTNEQLKSLLNNNKDEINQEHYITNEAGIMQEEMVEVIVYNSLRDKLNV